MDIRGKTIVLTGASAGTGAAAARMLAARGARLVLVGRSPDKTERIARELGVTAHTMDMLQLSDVCLLAADLRSELQRIDVLLLNAGEVIADRHPTLDGIEPNLQVNAIAPWLLMTLLADIARGGRIIATASRSHTGAQLDLTQLDNTESLSPHQRYARAKLAGGVLLRELGRRHKDITVADFHPGIIASDMGRYKGRLGSVLKVLAAPFIDAPEDGARRMLHLVTTDAAIGGGYHVDDRPAPGSPQLRDAALGAALWAHAEARTAAHRPLRQLLSR